MEVNTFTCSVCSLTSDLLWFVCLFPPELLFRKAQHNGFALVLVLEAQAGYCSRAVARSFSLLACTFRRFKTFQILNLSFLKLSNELCWVEFDMDCQASVMKTHPLEIHSPSDPSCLPVILLHFHLERQLPPLYHFHHSGDLLPVLMISLVNSR